LIENDFGFSRLIYIPPLIRITKFNGGLTAI
jgi:hypothetical protein